MTPWTVACQAPLSIGILQARILEWVTMLSSRGSSQLRDRTHMSRIAGRFFTVWDTREAPWPSQIFPTHNLKNNLPKISILYNPSTWDSSLVPQCYRVKPKHLTQSGIQTMMAWPGPSSSPYTPVPMFIPGIVSFWATTYSFTLCYKALPSFYQVYSRSPFVYQSWWPPPGSIHMPLPQPINKTD